MMKHTVQRIVAGVSESVRCLDAKVCFFSPTGCLFSFLFSLIVLFFEER